MQKKLTLVPVVAAAMLRPDGCVLMHRRAEGAMHGGLWEFPGGKVEPGESRELALVRELLEELDVAVSADSLQHVAQAGQETEAAQGGKRIVIDLYTCRHWDGMPRCMVGQEIGWFAPASLSALAMPPLDYPLADGLLKALRTM